MADGEAAVLFTGDRPEELNGTETPDAGFCVVAGSLAEGEQYAREAVAAQPKMIARIYDRRGMVGAPLAEFAGSQANRSEISAKFRRWGGGSLFVVGVLLGAAELISGMRINWAGMLAARLIPVGVILLLTELGLVLGARRERKRKQA